MELSLPGTKVCGSESSIIHGREGREGKGREKRGCILFILCIQKITPLGTHENDTRNKCVFASRRNWKLKFTSSEFIQFAFKAKHH